VIFTSDHGDMMGSQGRMMKQVPYEESARVPFLIRYPGVTPNGGSSNAMLVAVDMYPTLCGLAGIAVPTHCVGRDLSAVMRGGKVKESEMVFLMNEVTPDDNGTGVFAKTGEGVAHTDKWVNQPSYRGVRTKTHTYAVTLTGRWLLFDNVADPYQMKNLVNDPASKRLMETLDAAIVAWLKEAGDNFPYKENIKRITNFPS
jgi:arylsulfatase A-like enzyme